MKKTVSVIVPAYNVSDCILSCLNSIVNQTCKDLEIVVVDDGSVDGTAAILDEYAKENKQVKIIHQENQGVTSARLCGIRASEGDWIGFVDGDDEIEPEMFELLLRNAMDNQAEISHCGYQMCFPDGRIHYFYNTGCMRTQSGQEATKELLAGEFEPGLCNKLFHRSLLVSFLDEQVMDTSIKNNEDLLMNYYLFCKAYKTVFEDVCPYHYLVRDNSASRRKLNRHMIWDPIRVREIILKNCDTVLEVDAEKALLTSCIYTYCGLTKHNDYKADQEEVRKIILDHRNGIRDLPRRTKILARLIIEARGLLAILYPVYSCCFQVKKYE